MKKIAPVLSFFLLLANLTFAQTSPGKIALPKGSKFEITNVTKGTVGMEMMGQNMETVTESSDVSTVEVKDATATGYNLTGTLTKIKLNVSGGMSSPISVDSDKKGDLDTEVGQTFKDKLNKPTDVQVDLSGKKIENKEATKNEDEDMKKSMQAIMGAGAQNGVETAFLVIPAGKKAGDTWTDSTISDGIKIINNYTLSEVKGKDAVVLTNTNANASKTVNAQGNDLAVTMNSKVNAKTVVDITTGLIKEKTTTIDGKGGIDTGGQSMPMTIKTTTTTVVRSL